MSVQSDANAAHSLSQDRVAARSRVARARERATSEASRTQEHASALKPGTQAEAHVPRALRISSQRCFPGQRAGLEPTVHRASGLGEYGDVFRRGRSRNQSRERSGLGEYGDGSAEKCANTAPMPSAGQITESIARTERFGRIRRWLRLRRGRSRNQSRERSGLTESPAGRQQGNALPRSTPVCRERQGTNTASAARNSAGNACSLRAEA